MHHVMFDVDGTLVQSYEFDEQYYLAAVEEVLGESLDNDWTRYTHVTDSGILLQYLELRGLIDELEQIEQAVKASFIRRVNEHLAENPVCEVPGAAAFIAQLREIESISLSIATGGWLETALLKLGSAGIDITGIPIATSSDHYSRTEIMKLAHSKAAVPANHSLTYFGDAAWDKRACAMLGYNFVLVGDRVSHDQMITDYRAHQLALAYIGV